MLKTTASKYVATVAAGVSIPLIVWIVITLVNVHSLKAFADQGKRFTQADFDKHQEDIKPKFDTMQNNSEAIIRMEAIQNESLGILRKLDARTGP